MRKVAICILVFATGSATLNAYEFRTHNGVTHAARGYLLANPGLFNDDPDFKRFLESSVNHGFGYLIDMGAGDPCEDTDHKCRLHTDEDHREGKLKRRWLRGCEYWERHCGFRCTFDHFLPRLPLPLGLRNQNAVEHLRSYMDMAYRLYRAGKCSGNDTSFRWAAMALGTSMDMLVRGFCRSW